MATAAQVPDSSEVLLDAPKDGNAGTAQQQPTEFGPNFEKLAELKPKLAEALRELVKKYRMEGMYARRMEIRRIKKARLFWQGLQYCWWDEKEQGIRFLQDGAATDEELAEMPRYQFVTNFYQAFGLSFIAAITQSVPSVPFFPTSTEVQEDITTANAASDVADLIERNNKPPVLLSKIGFHCWNDGKLGAYVRFIADGERFGWKDYPTFEAQPVEMQPAMHGCQNCGEMTPATPDSQANGTVCATCGQPMGPDTFQPPITASRPVQTSVQRTAKGQEVISIIGGLELNTPVYTNEMHEMPYLQWDIETHKARLKAAFPHIAKKLQASAASGADEVYARTTRLAVVQNSPQNLPGDALQNLLTFSRTWLRPWAFAEVDDEETKKELAQLFPDGCYVAFAGEDYCEARNESMDDHWRVMHAIPGDGQSRPSVGDSMVEVQERYNILTDIEAEQLEYGIPPIYADPQVLDFDSLANQVAEPAAHYPARARAGRALEDGFFQPNAAQVPPELQALKRELMGEVSQFLSGLFPAVFGGEMANVDTAQGYAMARDQAMGRLGLIWRAIKTFYGEAIFLGVECFRKNRPEDVEIPYLGENDDFKSKWIRLADLKGNIMVQPEEDETFPALRSQIRGALTQLMEAAKDNDVVAKALTAPANMTYIKGVLGLRDLQNPGEDSRTKQLREIEDLLKSAPTTLPPPPSQPGPDGQPGPPQQPQIVPTVPIDDFLDDHDIELESLKEWANSDDGQTARIDNPQGFANVRAHGMAHAQAIDAKKQNQNKPPSESMNFKDMPPGGKVQMAGQAGITLNPAELVAREQQDRKDKQDQAKAKLKNGSGGGKND